MNLKLSIAARDAALNGGGVTPLLNGGFLKIYAGTQPASPDASLGSATLLATLTLSSTAFEAASGGSATANAIGSTTGAAGGTASFYRAFAADGTTAHIDGDVGTSGADLVLNNLAITTGIGVSVSSWVLTMPTNGS